MTGGVGRNVGVHMEMYVTGGVTVIWHYYDWGYTAYVAQVLGWVWLWVDHGDTAG